MTLPLLSVVIESNQCSIKIYQQTKRNSSFLIKITNQTQPTLSNQIIRNMRL